MEPVKLKDEIVSAYQDRQKQIIERYQAQIDCALSQVEGAQMILIRCKNGLNDLLEPLEHVLERISAIEERLTENVDQMEVESTAYKNCPLPAPAKVKGKGLKKRSLRSENALILIKG